MIKKLFYILLITILWGACQETDTDSVAVDYDYSYFPQDSGFWREFEVTYIEIDKASNIYDTTHYFLLEKWGESIIESSGDTMISLERYTRSTSNESWNIASIWKAGILNHQAIQVEENNRIIKLDFPLRLDKSWNGNIYNRLDTINLYNFKIETMDGIYENNDLSFDSILIVVQKNKSTLIDKIYFDEKYAPGIGLIEINQTDIYSGGNDYDPTIPIEERISKGTIYIQKLTKYGN